MTMRRLTLKNFKFYWCYSQGLLIFLMMVLISVGTLTHNDLLFEIPLVIIGLSLLLTSIIGTALKAFKYCHSFTPHDTGPMVVLTPNQEKDLEKSQAADSENSESTAFIDHLPEKSPN